MLCCRPPFPYSALRGWVANGCIHSIPACCLFLCLPSCFQSLAFLCVTCPPRQKPHLFQCKSWFCCEVFSATCTAHSSASHLLHPHHSTTATSPVLRGLWVCPRSVLLGFEEFVIANASLCSLPAVDWWCILQLLPLWDLFGSCVGKVTFFNGG